MVETYTEKDLHAWGGTLDKTVAFRVAYARMLDGDAYEAAILSQIAYRFGASEGSEYSRAIVEKNGHTWVRISYDQWWAEIGIKKDKARRAIDRLVAKGFLIRDLFKGDQGAPMVHVRMNIKKILEAANKK
jgi:hypothetical protein